MSRERMARPLVLLLLAGCSPAVEPQASAGGTSEGTGQPASSSTTLVSESMSSSNETSSDAGSTSLIAATEVGTTTGTVTGSEDTGFTCWGNWTWEGCALLDAPNVNGTVETPLGSFEVSYAYFGAQRYCSSCVSEGNVGVVYLLPNPISQERDWIDAEEMLVLEPGQGDGFTGPTGESISGARLEVIRDNMSDQVFDATFSLDSIPDPQSLTEPFDPANAAAISGSVQKSGDGWQVDLTFAASYCPMGDTSYICE